MLTITVLFKKFQKFKKFKGLMGLRSFTQISQRPQIILFRTRIARIYTDYFK